MRHADQAGGEGERGVRHQGGRPQARRQDTRRSQGRLPRHRRGCVTRCCILGNMPPFGRACTSPAALLSEGTPWQCHSIPPKQRCRFIEGRCCGTTPQDSCCTRETSRSLIIDAKPALLPSRRRLSAPQAQACRQRQRQRSQARQVGSRRRHLTRQPVAVVRAQRLPVGCPACGSGAAVSCPAGSRRVAAVCSGAAVCQLRHSGRCGAGPSACVGLPDSGHTLYLQEASRCRNVGAGFAASHGF